LAPASGQIKSVRLKGIALSDPKAGIPGGETMWHLQALQRQPDGTFKVLRTSGAFYVPTTGDPQQITTYAPENFCVDKGDVLAFNTVGGWDGIVTATGPYPNGTPLQIFSRVPGALVSQFTGADKTNNGDILRADNARGAGEELLMQMTLGTASDAFLYCPGGTYDPQHPDRPAGAPGTPPPPPPPKPARKVTIPKQRITVSRKGKLTIALFCQPGVGPCAGVVRVLSPKGKPVTFASHSFTIPSKSTGKVSVTLRAPALRTFKRAGGRLAVKVVSQITPGGAAVTAAMTLRPRGG
jgi:hypothetical protein